MPLAKLVVLISGQGTNLQAILEACFTKKINAQVVSVISNNAEAFGLERAHRFNIPTHVHVKANPQTREEYDQELLEIIKVYQPDWIVLAGWMRILSLKFIEHFPQQIINIHPALPNIFPGTHAIERAFIAYKEGKIQHTGVMVHLVPDEGIDTGPVLGQKIVPIYAEDSLAELAHRMHETEHQLLIEVLKKLMG